MTQSNEFEVVHYPRLNHVRIDFTEVYYRNHHIHRAFELGLILSGSCTLNLEGQTITLAEGDIYMFNPGQAHSLSSADTNGARIVYLQISNCFCRDYVTDLHDLRLLCHVLTNELSGSDADMLTSLLLTAVDDYTSEEELSSLMILRDITALLCFVFTHLPYVRYDAAELQQQGKRAARMRRILEYIDAHITEKLSLTELAAMENVTVPYLSTFFHSYMGMTFQSYLNDLRLARAASLLLHTRMRLIDISMECGFSDPKYLNKAFRNRYGCLPKEFRSEEHGSPTLLTDPNQLQKQPDQQTATDWINEFRARRQRTPFRGGVRT